MHRKIGGTNPAVPHMVARRLNLRGMAMKTAARGDRTPAAPETAPDAPDERPDLAAWRQRHELRRSNAAQPIPSARQYRRTGKHRNRQRDW